MSVKETTRHSEEIMYNALTKMIELHRKIANGEVQVSSVEEEQGNHSAKALTIRYHEYK